MTIKLLLAAALAAVVLPASVSAAPSPIGHLYSKCGQVTVAGHTWVYGRKGLSCAAAKAVVRTLGSGSHADGLVGTYAGMHCFYGQRAAQAVINCLGPHALMLAVRPK
jgi:hypothetical protein